MSIDPYESSVDALGPPYANAYEVDMEALETADVELPFVSSALLVSGDGITSLKMTMQGGSVVTLQLGGGLHRIPIRVTHIHSLSPADNSEWRPRSILAVW